MEIPHKNNIEICFVLNFQVNALIPLNQPPKIIDSEGMGDICP